MVLRGSLADQSKALSSGAGPSGPDFNARFGAIMGKYLLPSFVGLTGWTALPHHLCLRSMIALVVAQAQYLKYMLNCAQHDQLPSAQSIPSTYLCRDSCAKAQGSSAQGRLLL